MANAEHFEILKSGVKIWNKLRKSNEIVQPELFEAFLSGANLSDVNFFNANLIGANLSGAKMPRADLTLTSLYNANLSKANLSKAYLNDAELIQANLTGANLIGAKMSGANMSRANLTGANLTGADLSFVDLSYANLTGAILTGTTLTRASLIEATLNNAIIKGAKIYGVSTWGIKKENIIQKDLIITKDDVPEITVDNLEVAQFIYMLLNNQNVRDIIDTLTSKTVLILGRFSNNRKPLLDAIKDELRKRNYLPILFDFEKPASRDLTETISILARMSRFVIADLTDAKSIPQELSHFVPDTFLPVVPIILQEQQEYGMFEHFKRYDWVLPIHQYETPETMLTGILENVIEPAERKVEELRAKRK